MMYSNKVSGVGRKNHEGNLGGRGCESCSSGRARDGPATINTAIVGTRTAPRGRSHSIAAVTDGKCISEGSVLGVLG